MPSIGERLRNSWNAFLGRDPTKEDFSEAYYEAAYGGYSSRPDRVKLNVRNERSIVNTIYNQIAVDVSMTNINHMRVDNNNKFVEVIKSDLNNALTVSANIDQTGRALTKDLVLSMFDEGCVAVVPVVTDHNPDDGAYKIYELRTGKIISWFPKHIRVEVYNDNTGQKQQIVVPKESTAIIENPFYSIMNEPNSTLQRLIRVLNQIDRFNENNSAGKLDLIIQLPYTIKSPARREQAEMRRKDIENQLTGSQYGIAYTDGTEKVVQLNRSLENNLWTEAKDLIEQLYNQLGFAPTIFNGTADEKTMLNYYNNTLAPILTTITEEYKRKWLTPTAITQGQTIGFIRDPFRLVPVNDLAEIADKFTRNEIMSSNEIRAVIGMRPADDPKADMLVNSNLNQANNDPRFQAEEEEYKDAVEDEEGELSEENDISEEDAERWMEELDDIDIQIDELEDYLNHSIDYISDEFLSHYASPYYDPVKAHEYYEEHKQLIGRKSTKGLNDAGKEAAKYVKKRLTEERKARVDEHKNLTDKEKKSNRESTNNEIKSHSEKMKSRISALKEDLKKMSKEEKEKNKERIENKIARLREENASKKASLREALKGTISSLTETHKGVRESLKNEYDEKYVSELDSIKADPSFIKEKKAKGRKSGTGRKGRSSESTGKTRRKFAERGWKN